MGTRYNRLMEAVLTCTHNQCFEQTLKKYDFHLKINIFAALQNRTLLHWRVCVMHLYEEMFKSH